METVYLSLPPHTTTETPEGNDLLLLNNVSQIMKSFLQMHMFYGLGSFTSVLEVNPQVHTASLTCWVVTDSEYLPPTTIDMNSHFAAFSGSVAYLPMAELCL